MWDKTLAFCVTIVVVELFLPVLAKTLKRFRVAVVMFACNW